MSGPRYIRPVAAPRFSTLTQSATVPMLSVIGQLAAMPVKKRNTMRELRLGARAQATLKIKKTKLLIL